MSSQMGATAHDELMNQYRVPLLGTATPGAGDATRLSAVHLLLLHAVALISDCKIATPCPVVVQVEMSTYLKSGLKVRQLVANGNEGHRSRSVFDPAAPLADVRSACASAALRQTLNPAVLA